MCGSVQNIILLFTLSLQHIVRILCTACKVSTRIPTWPIFATMYRIQSTLYVIQNPIMQCAWHDISSLTNEPEVTLVMIINIILDSLFDQTANSVPFLHKIGLKMQNNLWHVKRQWEYGMLLFLLLCKNKNMYHYTTYFFNCFGVSQIKKKKKKKLYSARIH